MVVLASSSSRSAFSCLSPSRGWLVLVLALAVLAGCAQPKLVEKPKLLTETEMRAKLNEAHSAQALAAIGDRAVREPIERYFAQRSQDLKPRGMKLAVDRALVGENMGIGDGLALRRVFVLFHQYNDVTFDTLLAAFEVVGGSLRLALTKPVGGSNRAFTTLDEIDLDRVILSVTTFSEKDLPCCPSVTGQTAFQLRGVTLEPLR